MPLDRLARPCPTRRPQLFRTPVPHVRLCQASPGDGFPETDVAGASGRSSSSARLLAHRPDVGSVVQLAPPGMDSVQLPIRRVGFKQWNSNRDRTEFRTVGTAGGNVPV